MVLSVQLSLVSRVILISTDLFYKAIQEASNGLVEYDSDPAKVLNRMLHVWTEKMNLITQVERWKVVGELTFYINSWYISCRLTLLGVKYRRSGPTTGLSLIATLRCMLRMHWKNANMR